MHLSINRMIPNILTLLALCAGMTGIRLAIVGKFETAVVAIIVAAALLFRTHPVVEELRRATAQEND